MRFGSVLISRVQYWEILGKKLLIGRSVNAAFSQKIPSVSVVQFTVQMFKLNGLGKTHRERLFVVELKLKLRSLFHCEQIAWENSGIKWMKVPSFSLTVTKYLTF